MGRAHDNRADSESHGTQAYIVALTAHVTADVRTRCQEAGMDDMLTKPIQRAALERVLATAASRAS